MTERRQMSQAAAGRAWGVGRALIATGRFIAGSLALVLSLLAGYGFLYGLRGLGWLATGSRVRDSLPLLQLAGFDVQPLGRVVVAWLLAGLLAGVALIRVRPLRRALVSGALGLVLLLIASQSAYALARNVGFSSVLFSRQPGFGPWLEALAFTAGCALPRPVFGSQRARGRRVAFGRLRAAGDSGLRRG